MADLTELSCRYVGSLAELVTGYYRASFACTAGGLTGGILMTPTLTPPLVATGAVTGCGVAISYDAPANQSMMRHVNEEVTQACLGALLPVSPVPLPEMASVKQHR